MKTNKNKAKTNAETAMPEEKTTMAAVIDVPLQNGPAGLDGMSSEMGEFKLLRRGDMRPDPNQPRKVFDEVRLNDLAKSIRAQGIIQPILVKWVDLELKIREPDMMNDQKWQAVSKAGAVMFESLDETAVKTFAEGKLEGFYQIIDGERRWRASELAELAEVPVVVRSMDAATVFNAQWTSNQQRDNLSALEEGTAFEQQIAERQKAQPDFSAELLAAELGVARGTVYNRLKLVRLHGPVRLALEAGTIDPTVAGEICIIPSREDQEEMLSVIRNSAQMGQSFSFREVREYIQNNFAKQLTDAPFDIKEPDYFPGGVEAKESWFPGPCTKCPMRSGNMKEMFPDIKNPNVCTNPKCFAEKSVMHGARLAAEHRSEGNEVIERDEFYKRQAEFVRVDGPPVYAGDRWLDVKQIVGKKKPKKTLVQNGTEFEEFYRKVDVIEAGKANGFSMEQPKPKAEPKPKATPKPKTNPEPEVSDTDREKAREKQRKQEEKERKEEEQAEARVKLKAAVAVSALNELQQKIEKAPVNSVKEEVFWQFLCEQPGFLESTIFYNGRQTLDRRGIKGDIIKTVSNMSYPEFKSAVLEQFLIGEDQHVCGEGYSSQFVDACKFLGVDLKRIERELGDKNRELAGMPEPAVKQKGTKKTKGKK